MTTVSQSGGTSPGRIILTSFLLVIALGTFLLSLPQAHEAPLPLLDALFTAVSATCVTGLAVVPFSSFTFFGQCVIAALVQIGGLGLITLSFFLASFFLNFGMAAQFLAGQILEFEFWNKTRRFLTLIIGITLSAEIIGAAVLYVQFQELGDMENCLFLAIFHSISAFCNAGISLFDESLALFVRKPFILITLGLLMFAGSIGFIVWYECIRMARAIVKRLLGTQEKVTVSLHTRIVLSSSIILGLAGGFLFLFLEYGNVLASVEPFEKLTGALFNSFSARGVGFTTFTITKIMPATFLLFLPLMFIGASPGSTGSGIKTTTFVVFIATIVSIIKNRESVELGGRRIPHDQVYKVMAIIALSILWIFTSTFVLLMTHKNVTFMHVLFEAVSAFGCAGLSIGITPHFSTLGKGILIASMLVGRIGSLTLVLSLRRSKQKHLYQYPEERIMIG